MAKIISGKEVAAALNQKTAKEVETLKAKGVEVSLAVILVGDDPASKVYVNNKKKSCEKLGITSYEFLLPAETQQSELLALIDELNSRDDISGILCQFLFTNMNLSTSKFLQLLLLQFYNLFCRFHCCYCLGYFLICQRSTPTS